MAMDGALQNADDVEEHADCVTSLDVTRSRYTSFTVEWEYMRTADWDEDTEGMQPAPEVKEFLVRYQESAAAAFDMAPTGKNIGTMKVKRNMEADDEDHEATVTGLTPGKSYLVGVSSVPKSAAHESSGERLFQGTGMETDAADEPDDVLGLELVAGNGEITAMWDEASDNGSDVTGYEVQHREMGKDWPSTSSRSGGTATSAADTSTMWTISNLKNGTEYDVRVRAYSYGTTSDDIWSDIESATPSADAPTPTTPTPTPTPAIPTAGLFLLGAGLVAGARKRFRQKRLTR